MRHAIAPRDSRNLVNKDLLDSAGSGEFFDALQPLALVAIRIARNGLATHFSDRIAFSLGVVGEFVELARAVSCFEVETRTRIATGTSCFVTIPPYTGEIFELTFDSLDTPVVLTTGSS
jgi:hypothetical protein